jgi:drug/metabolite transporter (DMT)-like permease
MTWIAWLIFLAAAILEVGGFREKIPFTTWLGAGIIVFEGLVIQFGPK